LFDSHQQHNTTKPKQSAASLFGSTSASVASTNFSVDSNNNEDDNDDLFKVAKHYMQHESAQKKLSKDFDIDSYIAQNKSNTSKSLFD